MILIADVTVKGITPLGSTDTTQTACFSSRQLNENVHSAIHLSGLNLGRGGRNLGSNQIVIAVLLGLLWYEV